tara:strand:- start:43 stop:474 length:432 start_codon:yes stop_codon:yes gene_type:complete
MNVLIPVSINISDNTGTPVDSSNYKNPARDLPTIVNPTLVGSPLAGTSMQWQRSANGTVWETMSTTPSLTGATTDEYSGSRALQAEGITGRRAPFFRLRVTGVEAARGNPAYTSSLQTDALSFWMREEERVDGTPNYTLETIS